MTKTASMKGVTLAKVQGKLKRCGLVLLGYNPGVTLSSFDSLTFKSCKFNDEQWELVEKLCDQIIELRAQRGEGSEEDFGLGDLVVIEMHDTKWDKQRAVVIDWYQGSGAVEVEDSTMVLNFKSKRGLRLITKKKKK